VHGDHPSHGDGMGAVRESGASATPAAVERHPVTAVVAHDISEHATMGNLEDVDTACGEEPVGLREDPRRGLSDTDAHAPKGGGVSVTVSGVTERDRGRDRLTCGVASGVSRRARRVTVTF
jgi:hypothetical protein